MQTVQHTILTDKLLYWESMECVFPPAYGLEELDGCSSIGGGNDIREE